MPIGWFEPISREHGTERGSRDTGSNKTAPRPAPIAPRRPHSFTAHGITVIDDYAWLKDANWQEVLRDPACWTRISANISKRKTPIPKACSDIPPPCKKRWSRKCAGGSRKTIPACLRRMALRLYAQIPRGRPARNVRPHAAQRRRDRDRARWRRSLRPTMNISSSAVRGIRPITGFRPGARTSRARNISRSGCATGPTAGP